MRASAANGITYNGVTVGSGYDATVISRGNVALVRLLSLQSCETLFGELELERGDDLDKIAVRLACNPPFDDLFEEGSEGWEAVAAKWDAWVAR